MSRADPNDETLTSQFGPACELRVQRASVRVHFEGQTGYFTMRTIWITGLGTKAMTLVSTGRYVRSKSLPVKLGFLPTLFV